MFSGSEMAEWFGFFSGGWQERRKGIEMSP